MSCHGICTAAHARAQAADLLRDPHQQLLDGRIAAVSARPVLCSAVPDGHGSISLMLVVVLRIVRPPPGPCGQPSTWQPPVEGLWGHGCGRRSSLGWSQVVADRSPHGPSRRLRGYGRPAGWVSQSEELCGPYAKVDAVEVPTLYAENAIPSNHG